MLEIEITVLSIQALFGAGFGCVLTGAVDVSRVEACLHKADRPQMS